MDFLTPKDISIILKKSPRWVYKHALELGGVQVGKSWFFTMEGLKNALQRQQEEQMERCRQAQQGSIYETIREKTRCESLGTRKKRKVVEDYNRHGLYDVL